ncbi:DoxX family protein [Catalinimonas niigatensis]|uniref:DoxX family protein n=1 Tax=Catalinimonas niigatensis TaxID=1397264 RepID=UPI0026652ED2|nr:DoxX family protein [Catalinimonas niigatensis]WPP51939.1 DoxX family protein [Catalinimonas niigatensis]
MEKEISIKTKSFQSRIIAFRTVTLILVIGMLAGGISTLVRVEYQVNIFNHLDYPLFLMSMIGIAKILAAIVLILPGIPLLKIGAYVGIFIVSICAFISHVVANDSVGAMMNPLILTAIVLAAHFLNPYIKVVSTARV